MTKQPKPTLHHRAIRQVGARAIRSRHWREDPARGHRSALGRDPRPHGWVSGRSAKCHRRVQPPGTGRVV